MATPQPLNQSQTSAAGAIAFLRSLDADGVHSIAAFHANTEKKEFLTFRLHQAEMAQRWVEARIQSCNLYYSLNEPREDLGNNKASKSDIANIRAVALDLDPADGMPLDEARAELQPMLRAVCSHEEHFPTFSVDSGGGYQTVWLLQEKLPADGRSEGVEAQTRGLALHFGGDSAATDVSRLLRLPYTTNFPTKTKLARGRTHPRPAGLIENTENRVSLGDLSELAPPVAATKRASGAAVAVAIDMDEVQAVACFDDLPEPLKTRFSADLETDERLRRLWDGDTTLLGNDTSGSGFSFALGAKLRKTGRYTPTEFGQLLHAWDYSSADKTKIDERYIARAWSRTNAASAEEEFEAVEIDAGKPSSTPKDRGLCVQNVNTFAWSVDQTRPLVKGLLNYGMLAMMSGPSNAGKSPLALDLLASIAKGEPWRGLRVRKSYGLYISTEGLTGLGNRIEALRRTRFADADGDAPLEFYAGSIDLRGSRRDAEWISAVVLDGAARFDVPPGLVVIDTLSHTLGGGDESDSTHIRAVLRNCKRITDTGAAVMWLHHPTKDGGSLYRGSSLLVNDVDLLISVEHDRKTGTRTLSTPRVKEFAEIRKQRFSIKVVHLGTNADGDDVTSVVVEWKAPAESEFSDSEIFLPNADRPAFEWLKKHRAESGRGARFTEWFKGFEETRGGDPRSDPVKNAFKRKLKKWVAAGLVTKNEKNQYVIPN